MSSNIKCSSSIHQNASAASQKSLVRTRSDSKDNSKAISKHISKDNSKDNSKYNSKDNSKDNSRNNSTGNSKNASKRASKRNSRNASPSRSANGLGKKVVTHEMTSDDNRYLANVVGEPLKLCLQELAEKVPEDPMEWISQWLYNYANAQLYFQEKASFLSDLDEARTLLEAENKKRAREIAEMKASKRTAIRNFNMMRPGGGSFSDGPSQSNFTGSTGITTKSRGGGINQGPSMHIRKKSVRQTDGTTTDDEYYDDFDDNDDGDEKEKEGKRGGGGKRGSRQHGHGKSQHKYQLDEDGNEFYRDEFGNRRYSRMSTEVDSQDAHQDARHAPSGSRATGAKLDKNHATWGVNCRLALVCQHPVLGDMEPRPPLMYPETPEWWDRKGYLPETLYDHEVYSRRQDNDKQDPNWAKMDPMSYKDFVEAGPWLASGYMMNAQESFKDLVCIPALPLVPVKRNRKEKEGDRFPKEARNQKMLLEQEEENNKLKQLEEDSRKKRMFKKE